MIWPGIGLLRSVRMVRAVVVRTVRPWSRARAEDIVLAVGVPAAGADGDRSLFRLLDGKSEQAARRKAWADGGEDGFQRADINEDVGRENEVIRAREGRIASTTSTRSPARRVR